MSNVIFLELTVLIFHRDVLEGNLCNYYRCKKVGSKQEALKMLFISSQQTHLFNH